MIHRNKKGFTLVEAIVTAVIIAILAGTAITLYNAYVTQARQEAVTNMAQTAAAAANAYWRKTNQDPPNIASLNLFVLDSNFNITISGKTITVTKGSCSATADFRP